MTDFCKKLQEEFKEIAKLSTGVKRYSKGNLNIEERARAIEIENQMNDNMCTPPTGGGKRSRKSRRTRKSKKTRKSRKNRRKSNRRKSRR